LSSDYDNWLKILTLLFYSLLEEMMMGQSTPFIVRVAALLLSTLSCCSAENVYCVTPTKPSDTSCSLCPHSSTNCATLSEYAQQAKSYFTSNTTMVFLSGDHTLDMNITVANISRLTLCGESSSGYVAKVVCSGSVGLSFMSMVALKIHSLAFISCGRSFDKYVMLLESTEYAELVNCSFQKNIGTALAVYQTSITLAENNEFTHNYCDHEGFIANSCVGVGGITALYSNLTFIGNTTFLRNHATFGSAGIYMINCSLSSTGSIHFINNSLTYFSEHCSVAIWASASFLNITGTSNFINNSGTIAVIAKHNTSLSFTGTSNFIDNSAVGGSAIVAHDNTSLSFTGISNFINNIGDFGGAICAGDNTSISFNGTSNFINNSAEWGGGVYLANSTLSILSNTTVYWENNQAAFGGAIYVEDIQYSNPLLYCTQLYTSRTQDECFFQLPGQNLSNGVDAQFIFKDNSAYNAGSVLYGGAIDHCKLTGLESPSSGKVFDALFHIKNDNTNSTISSDPFHICPCENNRPDCSKSGKSYTVYPGETFSVSVVAVGQRNGTASTTVIGRLTCDGIWCHTTHLGKLHPLQYAQITTNTCTFLKYTVFIFAQYSSPNLHLHADGPCSKFSNELHLKLDVIRTCPPGFNLSEIEGSCVCNQRLAEYTNHCNITNGLGRITHYPLNRFWVGYDSESNALILHPHCPFDYCASHTVDFLLNHTDLQCAYNRSGLLCGACKKGYSLVLGTSKCKQCTNIHLILLILFALMGLALIFFLLVSKLTVATGTLSGLVFYANIVRVNHTLFIPVESTSILSVFIAWLNLDFGIETCFYKGMDAYSKAWLQFVFPVYIWVLIGLIILASHFSCRFVKLLGNNPVSVLATLILLSYTKILRNLIAAIYITYLEYPTYNRGVWLYDANIDYLSIKHIPLFVLVILFFIFLFVPYILLLLFGQWLQAISHLRLFAWVNSARLKFFMDSYHAPYKARHCYWPGLLLVLRFILLVVFAINPQQDPSINLLAILVGTGVVQLWAWTSGGVYKNSYLDALEGSFALNLIILVGSTMYVNHSGGNQNQLAVGYTSVIIALITFIGILGIQLADVTGITPYLKRKYTDMKRQRMSNRLLYQAEAEVESESDTDSLPDRLINPNKYEPLSHTAQEQRVAEPLQAVNEERSSLIPVYTYGSIN